MDVGLRNQRNPRPTTEDAMGKKRTPAASAAAGKGVTLERASRLYQLLRTLETGPKTRGVILRRLRIDIRTFYRDLELLRDCDITVDLEKQRYSLDEAAKAIPRLPFPDPSLTFGEAQVLAKGGTKVHRKLKGLLSQITR